MGKKVHEELRVRLKEWMRLNIIGKSYDATGIETLKKR